MKAGDQETGWKILKAVASLFVDARLVLGKLFPGLPFMQWVKRVNLEEKIVLNFPLHFPFSCILFFGLILLRVNMVCQG